MASNPFLDSPNNESGYVPPSLDQTLSQDHDPFATATGLSSDAVVPAAPAAAETSGSVVLQFQESQLSTQYVSGKISQGGQVPAVGEAAPAPLPPQSTDELLQQKFSKFNIKFYRVYFNVDTKDVLTRMLDSLLCIVKPNFLDKNGDNPDLYGPFWICTTIVFLIAVVSNYIGWQQHGSKEGFDSAWKYDVDKVFSSAALFYGYVGVVGFVVWAVLKWFKSTIWLTQIWFTYGYGLAIFIPISILCAINSALARWLLIGISTLLSGLFIMLNLRLPVFESAGAKAVPLYIAMGLSHAVLGLALKFYFFRYTKPKE